MWGKEARAESIIVSTVEDLSVCQTSYKENQRQRKRENNNAHNFKAGCFFFSKIIVPDFLVAISFIVACDLLMRLYFRRREPKFQFQPPTVAEGSQGRTKYPKKETREGWQG